jgi:hypothetical protein
VNLSDKNYCTLDRSQLLFLRANEIARLGWGTLWDAMGYRTTPAAAARVLGLPPETCLNGRSCTNDFSPLKGLGAIVQFLYLIFRAKANEND